MSTKSTKLKTFNLNFDIKLATRIEVEAATLEDALAKGRETKVEDILDFNGYEHIDRFIEFIGVCGPGMDIP